MEVLRALQSCVTAKIHPQFVENDFVLLGEKKYLADTPTAFRKRTKEPYRLATLVTFYLACVAGGNFYGPVWFSLIDFMRYDWYVFYDHMFHVS